MVWVEPPLNFGCLTGSNSVFLARELSKAVPLAILANVCSPLLVGVVPKDADMARLILTAQAGVPQVFGVRNVSEVLPSVVITLAVDVVNFS